MSSSNQIHDSDYDTIARYTELDLLYLHLDFLTFLYEIEHTRPENITETERFLQLGVDPNYRASRYELDQVDSELEEMYDGLARQLLNETPLTVAVLSGDHELIMYLLSVGADPNLKNGNGYSPLEIILGEEDPDKTIVDILISAGANLDDPFSQVRILEEKMNSANQQGNTEEAQNLSEIINSLYALVWNTVQSGGYYIG